MKVLEQKIKLRSLDVDFNNRIKLAAVFNYMQDIASEHADILNAGFNQLSELNTFWALSWCKVQMLSYPSFEQTINIKTWHKGYQKIYALRDFIFSDNGEKIFAKATSAWLLLDKSTHKIIGPAKAGLSEEHILKEDSLQDSPRKININAELIQICPRSVKYSDVDLNGHVNNSKYIEFVFDAIINSQKKGLVVNSLEINYLKELTLGTEIRIKYDSVNSEYLAAGYNCETAQNIFNAIIQYNE